MSTDPIRDMAILISDDKNKVRIGITERNGPGPETVLAFHDFDAAALSNLITHLGNYRAMMADVIPEKFDPGKVNVALTTSPAAYVGNEGDFSKRFIVAIRHPGFGWLGSSWTHDLGAQLTTRMMAEVMRMGRLKPGLLGPDGRKI